MEYVYAAMLLHKAGKKVDEAHLKKVLEAVGVHVDESRVKALVAALENVNIDEAVKQAAVVPVAAAHAPAHAEHKEEKKAAPKEEKKSEEEAAAGLGSLFG
jgi:large subunit ribosomal protein L12